jgi:hypothetical protein
MLSTDRHKNADWNNDSKYHIANTCLTEFRYISFFHCLTHISMSI